MKHECIDRRSFLKSTASGAVGAAVVGVPVSSIAWTNGMTIHPQISNNKVVCCYDTSMITNQTSANTATTLLAQHNVCNVNQIEADLDAMAQKLAEQPDAATAWSTIFRMPSSKQPNQVKAAIKVNCIEPQNMPRIAIVGKVCKELIKLGIGASNITIYDACDDASGDGKYSQFIGTGLPAGVIVQSGRGATSNVTVGTGSMSCATVVTSADILVNCGVNKGHIQTDKGGFTLSMKNHTGSMKFSCPSLTEMINQSKSTAIIGGNPPRQQLCIIDSIWASKGGPKVPPSHLPCRIVMGTFGPAVDIAVVRNIREPVLSATHTESAIATILSSFGLTENGLQWIVVPPASATGVVSGIAATGTVPVFRLSVAGGHAVPLHVDFSVPAGRTITAIEIYSMRGRKIKSMGTARNINLQVWDGLNDQGNRVTPGFYIARAYAGSDFEAKPFQLLFR